VWQLFVKMMATTVVLIGGRKSLKQMKINMAGEKEFCIDTKFWLQKTSSIIFSPAEIAGSNPNGAMDIFLL
jgi:hypothetical protein